MMDPLREAIKHRRARGLAAIDDSKLPGQPGSIGDAPALEKQEPQGDLAPEVTRVGDKLPSGYEDPEGLELQEGVEENNMMNPEHEPIPRGGMNVDQMGHEQSGDGDIETFLMSGHELDQPRNPKTLGARVRAALMSKKGK